MPEKPAKQIKASWLALALFSFGLILVSISIGWNIYQGRVLSFQTSNPATYQASQVRQDGQIPVRIIMPKVNIDLPVVESQIKDGVWEINPNGASHLASSARPGEKGKIILYGHNKLSLFGKATVLKKDDQIEVIAKDQTRHTYQILETKVVSPTDLSVLSAASDEELVFYTCTGLLDSNRFVILAKPRAS